MSNIKKHLFFSVMAYMLLGFGLGVELFGFSGGLSRGTVLIIWIGSVGGFMVVVFTSLQKVKDFLKETTQQHP